MEDIKCLQCEEKADFWVCLTCSATLCGRYPFSTLIKLFRSSKEHMLAHYAETTHPIALNIQDLSIWCYPCESYLGFSHFVPQYLFIILGTQATI